MKAIVRDTGEIVDVKFEYNPEDPSCYSYFNIVTKKEYSPMELDFGSPLHSKNIEDELITWEQRRYELAKSAMNSLLCSSSWQEKREDGFLPSKLADDAIMYADEMIRQLKTKENE